MSTRSNGEYQIAISDQRLTTKLQTEEDYKRLNGSFRNYTLPVIEIANAIYEGRPFTTVHKAWRKRENYVLGQHIGLDFDDASIDEVEKETFVQQYGGLIYTTPSSTATAPRSRVVFFLDTPIYQATNYTRSVQALLGIFGKADPSCKDPCRFFYGSLRCDLRILGGELPLEKVKRLIAAWESSQPTKRPYIPPTGDTSALLDRRVAEIMATANGSRNNTLNAQAFMAGVDIGRGLVERTLAESLLTQAGLAVGLPHDEVYRTVTKAIERGVAA